MIEIRLTYGFPYKFAVHHQKPYLYGKRKNHTIINKNNHSVVYDIITDKPLTAGCWQGSFNIKLTLTKE